jgi:hypothetical protein
MECVLSSGQIDLGDSGVKKAFRALTFRSVKNSRALVTVKFETVTGRSITRYYGDIGEYDDNRPHKLGLMVNDTACKITITFLAAEQKGFVVRDMRLLWEPVGTI